MHHVRQENLPFVGSSHEFIGTEHGDTSVSVFLFNGKPGSGPGPHRHPYDEIQFIREGRGVWTVNGQTFEGGAGDIFVIKNDRLRGLWKARLDVTKSPIHFSCTGGGDRAGFVENRDDWAATKLGSGDSRAGVALEAGEQFSLYWRPPRGIESSKKILSVRIRESHPFFNQGFRPIPCSVSAKVRRRASRFGHYC